MSTANVSAADALKGSSALTTKRSYALDALRGYAILTMVLSAFMTKDLPAWMHHAQVPPPDLVFNPNLPGITWVDLVFPFFIFSMGSAVPLALSKRIERGVPIWKLIFSTITRWFLLMGFAIYVSRVLPDWDVQSVALKNVISIFAFIFVFAVLVRIPDSWSPKARYGTRILGWVGALSLLYFGSHGGVRLRTQTWEQIWANSDIIIMILANVSLLGTLVWLATRKNLLARLGVLGIIMAFDLSKSVNPGWVYTLDSTLQIPHLLGLGVSRYLNIFIPATIIGDMILAWLKAPNDESENSGKSAWNPARLVAMIALMLGFLVLMLVGLFIRQIPATVIIAAAMLIIGRFLFMNPANSTEKLVQKFFTWGSYLLILGLIFEPYEDGIKKDPATMSYYYVSAGLAVFMLIAFTILIDLLKKQSWAQLLIYDGQNPMIAYTGRWTFVLPVLYLSHFNPMLDKIDTHFAAHPWVGFGHAVVSTVIIALFAALFSRKKIFWRT